MSPRLKYPLLYIASTLIFFIIATFGWNVSSIQLLDQSGRTLFETPLALGHRFTTTYIHSVELTTVEDEYLVAGRKIWTWQERVKSSNAGMPCFKPEHGIFRRTDEWLIFQGGRQAWDRYFLRIGNKRFGLNRLRLSPFGTADLYRIFPGLRLTVTATTTPLATAHFTNLDLLYKNVRLKNFSTYEDILNMLLCR